MLFNNLKLFTIKYKLIYKKISNNNNSYYINNKKYI